MLKAYGLKNCDTCRAARKWLTANNQPHEFFDLREIALDKDTISHWIVQAGLDIVLNKRGTTWRKLSDADKQALDESKAIELICLHPALIKRPVFVNGSVVSVGFPKEEVERQHLLRGQ